MARRAFDEDDLRVFEAHSLVEVDGSATAAAIRKAHGGDLPIQRLIGLERRGHMRFAFGGWSLTRQGVEEAHALRDRLAARATQERKRCPLAKPCEDVRICTCGVDNRPTPTETQVSE